MPGRFPSVFMLAVSSGSRQPIFTQTALLNLSCCHSFDIWDQASLANHGNFLAAPTEKKS
jgi:hypothetical protein